MVWVEDHFLSYQRNDYGHPQKLVVYTVNVTAKREKELEIARLAEHNRKIIEALPEFIFIFDDKFFLIDVMMAPGTVLLYPVEVLKGADVRSIYSLQVSELFLKNIHECLEDNQLREIEYPLDVDGRRYYFQARIVPFEGNKVLALIHDISDRVRRSNELIEAKRKAEEADSMKTLFLANMSHEIRTPLNSIVGFSDLLKDIEAFSPEEVKQFVDTINTNCTLLLALINDILDLSRIESGSMDFRFAGYNLTFVMQQIYDSQRLSMPRGVELVMKLPEGEGKSIVTDSVRLKQVINNFINNAKKFTTQGSITFGFQTEEPGYTVFFVEDTGSGISEENQRRIFERFYKVDSFTQGAGLGLSICQTIVERFRGEINVSSELGKGTRFTVRVPDFNE